MLTPGRLVEPLLQGSHDQRLTFREIRGGLRGIALLAHGLTQECRQRARKRRRVVPRPVCGENVSDAAVS